MGNYVQLISRSVDGFGSNPFVEIDIDPDFDNSFSEAFLLWKILIYSGSQGDIIANNSSISGIVQADNFFMGVHYHGGSFDWYAGSGSGTDFAPVLFDEWLTIEVHIEAGSPTVDIRLSSDFGDDLYSNISSPFLPADGVNYLSISPFPNSWVGSGGGDEFFDGIAVSQLAWSYTDWITDGGIVAGRWSFDGADPIGDAIANYPTPPWLAYVGTDPTSILVFEGGGDEDPDVDPADVPVPPAQRSVNVVLDGVDITDCVQSGSVTRKLNRPWEATLRMFTDCAPGDSCSHVKIYVGSDLFFHGFVLQISTEAGEDDNLMSEYTCQDPMFLWQWRPARDGPDSNDPGDFSNPQMFDEFARGPQIMEQMLLQSVDDSNPQFGEGTLFLEMGDFPFGAYYLGGAPTDWPMTIAEVFELMCSTGTLDCVLTPLETDDPMCRIDTYNGDYGTDHSDGPDGDSTVIFEYETGAHNVRSLRMVEDSSNVCNKLWYYLGPRVGVPTDPAGDQHWRANITGQDLDLEYPPGGQAVDDTNTPVGPPWAAADNEIGERVYNSRISGCGVRMEVQIFDGQGDENPSVARDLFRRQWQMEQWIRAVPRTLVHVTPVRTSENDLLPPAVTPINVGDFDIGDLVTVTAGTSVRGGFTGVQRIYAYTVSWDEDGVVEMGEIQTSSDQEGIIGL